MHRVSAGSSVSGAMLVLLAAVAAAAQDTARGGDLYLRHCAASHGLSAHGNGPMAPVLLIQPTDPTALAAREGGSFPLTRVLRRIDGRDPLVSRGSPMPVRGPFFEGQGADAALKRPDGQPVLMPGPVADVPVWLRSVQVAE